MRDLTTPLFIVATLLAFCIPANGGIYKYIDENGQVAYGDKPIEGAEKLKIRHRSNADDQLFDKDPGQESRSGEQNERDTVTQYSSLEILTPKNDKMVSDRTGSVEVILLPTPKLASNHELVITVDGKDISRGRHANVSLSQVPRGSHTVTARIIDAEGQTMLSADTVTFHVKRPVIDQNSPLAFDRNN